MKPDELPTKRGRPSTIALAPDKCAAALAHVARGLPISSALVLAGIDRANVAYFLTKNPKMRGEFCRAEAEFELGLIDGLTAKAPADARVAQWLLERRLGQGWVAVSRAEVTGKDGGPLQSLTISKALLASVGRAPDPEPRNVTASAVLESKSTGLPMRIGV